jgi:general stress protein YciG
MKGFAKIDPELHRQIASKGGKAVLPENRTFSKNANLASEAGKKGAAVRAERLRAEKAAKDGT